MRLEFSYVLADLKEALMRPDLAARPHKRRRRWIGRSITWLSFVYLAAAALWLLDTASRLPGPELKPPLDVKSDILPGALLATWICSIYLMVGWNLWRRSRKPVRVGERDKASVGTRMLAITLAVPVMAAAYFVLHVQSTLPWTPSPIVRVLVTTGPWIATIFMLFLVGSLQRRLTARVQWVATPSWKRSKTVELSDHGYLVFDETERNEFAWSYFPRARETENLLILVAEDNRQYIIPKRVFASDLELEQCRGILQTHIVNTEFLAKPKGFGVLPLPVMAIPPAEQ